MDFTNKCVYLGMPLGSRLVDIESAHNLYLPAKPGTGLKVIHWPNVNSSLGHCFNGLLCDCYAKQADHDITHFAMIHGDVVPESYWLSTMLEELERVDADVLSAVLAIKDSQGVSSTGLFYADRPDWPTRRLTFTEIHKSRLPRTFNHQDLIDNGLATGKDGEVMVINTGLWVARYKKPWFQDNKVVFRQTHEIKKLPRPDGKGDYLQCWFMPEDWWFARDLASWGARVYATSCVSVNHVGNSLFPNADPWGTAITDEQFLRFTQAAPSLQEPPRITAPLQEVIPVRPRPRRKKAPHGLDAPVSR